MSLTIMMIDVKGSSTIWVANPTGTAKLLDKLYLIVRDVVLQNKGFLVKCIGDAFLVTFDLPENAICCAVQLQQGQRKSRSKLMLRIGMAHGPVLVRDWEIQGCRLLDYFGNTVNTAARIESKVSCVGGFGFAFCSGLTGKSRISVKDQEMRDRTITFLGANLPQGTARPRMTRFVDQTMSQCAIGLKRSARLVPFSMLHGQICKPSTYLRGVSPVDVFTVDLSH